MRKVLAIILIISIYLCGCGVGGNYEEVIAEYFSEKFEDADNYSYDISDEKDIDRNHSDYEEIIEYIEDEFNCSEREIKNLKEIEVEVNVDYGYEESYTMRFIVGKLDGDWEIFDKDGGPWSTGYGYGGSYGVGGYSVTFG